VSVVSTEKPTRVTSNINVLEQLNRKSISSSIPPKILTRNTNIPVDSPNDDIDTENVSKRLNELLKSNKFSLNDFKQMFDVSSQTIDDILNRPKQWSILSHRIKIVYMKIANYLNNLPISNESINEMIIINEPEPKRRKVEIHEEEMKNQPLIDYNLNNSGSMGEISF
jgi:hypothetical protein